MWQDARLFSARGQKPAILKQNPANHITIMNETEFLQLSDTLFAHIQDTIDEGGWDLDCMGSGNVLTIEAGDGTQVVVNRHTPNRELWIAAKSGGYHFAEQDGRWLATRDGREFFEVLSEVLAAAAGEDVRISAPN